MFIAKITIFLGDSKLQTFFFTANKLLLWNKPVIYSWKLSGIIFCHFLLPSEVSTLHVTLLHGVEVMIHWGNQMVSVDGPHPLQQYSVIYLTSYLTTGFHNTVVVGEFRRVAIHRFTDRCNCAVVLTVTAVSLSIIWLSPCIWWIPSWLMGYANSVSPPNSLAI